MAFQLVRIEAAPDLVDQVYRSLLDAISDGSMAPGSRITQEEVAAQLAVSRQPRVAKVWPGGARPRGEGAKNYFAAIARTTSWKRARSAGFATSAGPRPQPLALGQTPSARKFS